MRSRDQSYPLRVARLPPRILLFRSDMQFGEGFDARVSSGRASRSCMSCVLRAGEEEKDEKEKKRLDICHT